MKINIIITEDLLNYIFQQESSKIVGKCMKRFEIHTNPTDQKTAIKEVLYEALRDLRDLIVINGKEGISLTKK